MVKTSFQMKKGHSSLGVMFCWQLTLEADSIGPITDHFIPELFYDFLFVQKGEMCYVDKAQEIEIPLAEQTLKTIHTQPLTFTFTPPIILFGARLSLNFAESFWEPQLPPNRFLAQKWVEPGNIDLATFAAQITETIEKRCVRKTAAQMLSPTLDESDWLSHYSPRHKRRLYKTVFGISKKEMHAIKGLHVFLGQTCDFASQNPRIIENIDSEVFYDQPHFNHLFKKMTDLSPLDYLQASSILQDNLMAASYNEIAAQLGTIEP
jgi:AraC-like DNA-binding protein